MSAVNKIINESSFDAELGFKIKILRQGKGISQEELGYALGTSYQQIQKYEAGKSKIPAQRIAICAKILDVSLEYLLYGDCDKSINPLYDKKTMNIASAIAQLPDNDIALQLYKLALLISDKQ